MANKKTLRISKIKILIGVIIMLIMGALLALAIIKYNQSMADYDAARDAWWNGNGSMPTNYPNPVFIILSGFGILIGLLIVIAGLTPYFTKLQLMQTKETMEYLGDDVVQVGKKGIDIAKPIVEKATDDIIVPTTKKIGGAVGESIGKTIYTAKNGNSEKEQSESSKKYCKYCGEELDEDSKFCHKCGKKL